MGAKATGNITASSQSITAPVGPRDASAKIFARGTYAGVTLAFEATPDGTNWYSVLAARLDGITTPGTSATLGTNASSLFIVPVQGMVAVRARSTGWTSGTAVVTVQVCSDLAIGFPTSDTELESPATKADNVSAPTTTSVYALPMVWNGATWDRARSNATAINSDTSTARTASGTGATFTNYNGREVVFFVNVTAVSGTTPSMTVRLQESYDGTNFVDIDTTNLQTAAITAAGIRKLSIGPALPTAANSSLNVAAIRLLRAAWTITGTTPSVTFATYFHASV